MTSEMFDTTDELRRILTEGRISVEAVHAITGISRDAVARLSASPSESGLSTSPPMLSAEESARLSALVAQLTEGLHVDDDLRVTAIIETLTAQCHLTHQNIALLTRTGLDDLERFLRDPTSVPLEKKYQLAIRASYLVTAVANAAPHPAWP